jgi:DNA transformation protein and related proteins
MAGSPAFQRIERDVLRLCSTIAAGKVCTYADLGAAIDVPARHVAYIVARLDDAQRAATPVHRLVGADGTVSKAQGAAERLAREGVALKNGKVAPLATYQCLPNTSKAKPERTTRPPEHTRSADSGAALAELRGLGPVSTQMLTSVGITTAKQLRKADLYALYARIKAQHPSASINLLYAMMGAAEDRDWRDIAKDRRTEVLIRLDDMGLLKPTKDNSK